MSSTAGMKTLKRRFNAWLLLQFQGDLSILCLPSAAARHLSGLRQPVQAFEEFIIWKCALVEAGCALALQVQCWAGVPNRAFSQDSVEQGESGIDTYDIARNSRIFRRKRGEGPHSALSGSLPTPVGHEVVSGVRKLVLVGAVREH